MRIQIEQTIEEHFRKHQALKKLEIKVLSLFFIDKVDNYLSENGIIRKYFEDAFNKLKVQFDDFKEIDVKTVHSGYFSKMKTEKAMELDKDTFDLIMKDKERLLSFDELVQFIFSHSALREGWDNPNVFNICTLNQSISNIKKQQEVGRGMRLPVDQNGQRMIGPFNLLTVVANESYADYVSKLQEEYVDEYGEDILPPKPLDANKKTVLRLKKGYELNPGFKELWKRVARRTRYAVHLDTEKLVEDCIDRINATISVGAIRVKIETVELSLQTGKGVITTFKGKAHEKIDKSYPVPDVMAYLGTETSLTRNTIIRILTGIRNLDLIFSDPQEFISSVALIIKETLADYLVNGIKYLQVDDWYKMELFKDIETNKDLILPVEKSIYEGVVWDSGVEKNFAESLENMSNVKLFIKLPNWFLVQTPVGEYNPDWAIVMYDTNQFGDVKEKLYFVTETKGTTNFDGLRPSEKRKIGCAQRHFEAIDVEYKIAKTAEDILK